MYVYFFDDIVIDYIDSIMRQGLIKWKYSKLELKKKIYQYLNLYIYKVFFFFLISKYLIFVWDIDINIFNAEKKNELQWWCVCIYPSVYQSIYYLGLIFPFLIDISNFKKKE